MQSPATRAQDKFHSNRSIEAGGSLVPGPCNLLARAWLPGSDSSAGAAQAVPARYPRSPWINDLFPLGGEASPQRELRGSTISAELSQLEAEGGQRWRGSGLSHLSAARIPTHVACTAAAESVSVVLGEKLWRERKGGCRELRLGRAGELVLPTPAPVLSEN